MIRKPYEIHETLSRKKINNHMVQHCTAVPYDC